MPNADPSDSSAPALDPGSTIHYQLRQHSETTLALVDVLDTALPPTRDRDTAREMFTGFEDVIATLPADDLVELRAVLFSDDPESVPAPSELMGGLIDRFFDKPWFVSVWEVLNRGFLRRQREPILLYSILVAAISELEQLAGKLVRNFYRLKPQAINGLKNDREAEFSLQDLLGMGSIDDAITLAVQRRVDQLMYQGVSSWRPYFRDNLGIDISSLGCDWSAVLEIFERRNVLVHQGGRATERYVRFAKSTLGTTVAPGTDLQPDEDYVRSAIVHLHTLGVLLLVAVSRKLDDSEDNGFPLSDLMDECYSALRNGWFECSLMLAKATPGYAADTADHLIAQVNEALSLKRLGDQKGMQAIATAMDVSAAAGVYKLAKAALTDDLDLVFKLLPGLIDSEEIAPRGVLEWPLLDEARADARMEIIMPLIRDSWNSDVPMYRYNERTRVLHRVDCSRAGSLPDILNPPAGARMCSICSPALDEEASSAT